VSVPVPAIRSITCENAPLVMGAGATGISVILVIFDPLDLEEAKRMFYKTVSGKVGE